MQVLVDWQEVTHQNLHKNNVVNKALTPIDNYDVTVDVMI